MQETSAANSEKTIMDTPAFKDERPSFLRLLAHRIAAYLHGVIGYSEVLKEQYFGPLNDKQMEYVGEVTRSALRLQTLINEAIDLFKYENGEIPVRFSEGLAGSILEASVADIRDPNGEAVPVELVISPEAADTVARLDETKIQRAIHYLVTCTAACALGNDPVRVEADKQAENLEIRVYSRGVRALWEEGSDVFEPFHPCLESGQSASPLGLSLATRFAQIHGGRVSLEKASDRDGDHFLMILPLFADITARHEGLS